MCSLCYTRTAFLQNPLPWKGNPPCPKPWAWMLMQTARSWIGDIPSLQFPSEQSGWFIQWFLSSSSQLRHFTVAGNQRGPAPALKPPDKPCKEDGRWVSPEWKSSNDRISYPVQGTRDFLQLARNESSIQDIFPGGAVAMSCPTLSKNPTVRLPVWQHRGRWCKPCCCSLADTAITNTLSRGSSGLHRQKNILLMQIVAISQMAKALWCQENGIAVMPLPHRR